MELLSYLRESEELMNDHFFIKKYALGCIDDLLSDSIEDGSLTKENIEYFKEQVVLVLNSVIFNVELEAVKQELINRINSCSAA